MRVVTGYLALDPDTALNQLRTLPGLGPFWSQAILLRAVGPTDVAIPGERRLRAEAAALFRGARSHRGRRRVPRAGRALATVSHLGPC